jgi:hypothetical protein
VAAAPATDANEPYADSIVSPEHAATRNEGEIKGRYGSRQARQTDEVAAGGIRARLRVMKHFHRLKVWGQLSGSRNEGQPDLFSAQQIPGEDLSIRASRASHGPGITDTL